MPAPPQVERPTGSPVGDLQLLPDRFHLYHALKWGFVGAAIFAEIVAVVWSYLHNQISENFVITDIALVAVGAALLSAAFAFGLLVYFTRRDERDKAAREEQKIETDHTSQLEALRSELGKAKASAEAVMKLHKITADDLALAKQSNLYTYLSVREVMIERCGPTIEGRGQCIITCRIDTIPGGQDAYLPDTLILSTKLGKQYLLILDPERGAYVAHSDPRAFDAEIKLTMTYSSTDETAVLMLHGPHFLSVTLRTKPGSMARFIRQHELDTSVQEVFAECRGLGLTYDPTLNAEVVPQQKTRSATEQ